MPIPHIAVKGFSPFWDNPEPDTFQDDVAEVRAGFLALGWKAPIIRTQAALAEAQANLAWLRAYCGIPDPVDSSVAVK